MINESSHILLVEDDKVLGKNLKERLEKEKYRIHWVQGQKDCEAIQDQWATFDLVIFDVTLNDGSGFELAKQLKNKTTVPFIFMTALSEAENRLLGYELGAEEFIPKPFHLRELLLRISHVLKAHAQEKKLQVGRVLIDFKAMNIKILSGEGAGIEQPIPLRDLKLLKYLIETTPRAVSRDELLDKVWGQDEFPSPRTIDNAIVRLRQWLQDDKGELIRSVRGVGYQWQELKSNNEEKK